MKLKITQDYMPKGKSGWKRNYAFVYVKIPKKWNAVLQGKDKPNIMETGHNERLLGIAFNEMRTLNKMREVI